MRASPRTLCLVFLFGTVVTVPAFAQQPSLTVYPACTGNPTKTDSDAAHGAYIAGKGSFDENDYARAVDYLKDAYRRDCTKHDLLNIIARAYELKGDRAEAVNALETYLKRVPPNEPGNEQIQRRIASLKSQIPAAPPTPVPIATPPVEPVPTALPPPPPPPGNPPPDRVTSEHGHTVGPWVMVGVGGAATVAGLVLLLVGQGKIADSKSMCPVKPLTMARECPDTFNGSAAQSSGNTLSAVGGVVGGLGLAAVAGGLIWHFTESTGPETRARLRPDVRPGYAGLTLGAHF